MDQTRTIKVVLVGNYCTGKTTWVIRLLNGEFETKYIPTKGVGVIPFSLETKNGPINFNIWDCAGQEVFLASREEYWIGADAAIILESDTPMRGEGKKWNNYKSVNQLKILIRKVTSHNIPIVVVKNVKTAPSNDNEINVETGVNILTPWNKLASELMS